MVWQESAVSIKMLGLGYVGAAIKTAFPSVGVCKLGRAMVGIVEPRLPGFSIPSGRRAYAGGGVKY